MKQTFKIGYIQTKGNGNGFVDIPNISNINVDAIGNLSFTIPDLSFLQESNLQITVYVYTNNSLAKTIINPESRDVTTSIYSSLISGENNVKLILEVSFQTDKETTKTISKESYSVVQIPISFDTPNKMVLIDNIGYGFNDTLFERSSYTKYNFDNDEYIESGLPVSPLGFFTPIVVNNKLFLFDSSDYGEPSSIIEFDVTKNKMYKVGELPCEGHYRTGWQVVAKDTDIYIWGADVDATEYRKTMFKFNTLTKEVSTLNVTLPYYISNIVGSAVVDNTLYMKNIVNSGDMGKDKGIDLKIDLETEKVSVTKYYTATSTKKIIQEATFTTDGQNIYIFGGYSLEDDVKTFYTKLQVLNVVSDELSETPVTNDEQFGPCASVIYNKNMYIFGKKGTSSSTSPILQIAYNIK